MRVVFDEKELQDIRAEFVQQLGELGVSKSGVWVPDWNRNLDVIVRVKVDGFTFEMTNRDFRVVLDSGETRAVPLIRMLRFCDHCQTWEFKMGQLIDVQPLTELRAVREWMTASANEFPQDKAPESDRITDLLSAYMQSQGYTRIGQSSRDYDLQKMLESLLS